MKNSKLLPIKIPQITTYHYLAFYLAVFNSKETTENFYYNNYIQWRCSSNFLYHEECVDLDFTLHKSFFLEFLPFLKIEDIKKPEYVGKEIQTICKCIDEGQYVILNLDKFYVKGFQEYNNRHHVHDCFVFGYDIDNNVFHIMAYNETGIFSMFQVDMNEVELALQPEYLIATPYILTVNVRNDIDPIEIDLPNIKKTLTDYLYGDNSLVKEYGYDTIDFYVYGCRVYDYLYMYLTSFITEQKPLEKMDFRFFRLIWEHKKCMLDRIIMIKGYHDIDESIITEYHDIVDKANIGKNLMLKLRLKQDYKILITLQKLIKEIREEEMAVIHKLIRAM